jgi:ribonuclease D
MALPPDLPLEISREEMLELPIRRYEGEIVLVETAQALERAAADLFQEPAIGFDTETRPAFRKGESHPPALAQAATARAVYLFPLQRLDFSATLGELLGEGAITKAGVALAEDLRQLQGLFPFQPAGVTDLGHAARRHGLRQTGLRNLAGIFLRARIAKGAKTTNWAARRLTAQQMTYAATDAWICRELYLRFTELEML